MGNREVRSFFSAHWSSVVKENLLLILKQINNPLKTHTVELLVINNYYTV